MATTLNPEKAQLKEGFVFNGLVSSPENIGTVGAGDPISSFTNKSSLGYMNAGSVAFTVSREYAELLSDTTRIKIRKDLITKNMMLAFNSVQISDSNLWDIRDGMQVQQGYSDGGFTGDLGFFGPDEPVRAKESILLESQDVAGKPYNIMAFSCLNTSEDISETRSGDAHVEIPMSFELFPHPNFDVTIPTQKQKAYGLKWIDLS